jgi:hypothetical protein
MFSAQDAFAAMLDAQHVLVQHDSKMKQKLI